MVGRGRRILRLSERNSFIPGEQENRQAEQTQPAGDRGNHTTTVQGEEVCFVKHWGISLGSLGTLRAVEFDVSFLRLISGYDLGRRAESHGSLPVDAYRSK